MIKLPNLRDIFSSVISHDMAVDLGTASTLVYVQGKGIVLHQPSVVAIEKKTGMAIAVGDEAKKMLGRTPDEIKAIRPMKDGVIADFEICEEMLRAFIKMAQKRRSIVKPRVIVCVPSGITEVEKRAVRDSAEHAGAREVYLVAEPIAAAIGVGLPVSSPIGSMVIDIGGGTTEIAVIALSGIVSNTSIRTAGDEMDEAIVEYLRKSYSVLIGEQTAEDIKIKIGSAFPVEESREMEVKGRDLVSGIPRAVKVRSEEIREALREPINLIVLAVKKALEQTPPELAADIVDAGIVMTGGGSLLKGLDALLREETNLPIKVADNPRECIVLGAGRILESQDNFDNVLMQSRRE
ncbi:MAG: rod shape-determining protein [Candidatus Edwardsbacteria bacterium RIFOXYD12_FULL_50_11]|uniref:Cell shape-determining protein MreB n=1 Tax=Candidatus Edwardsbacteria bacterium GWF2_54_11 TaxID=1817851 RepID=A0A1F5R1X2_9BACT|nr:MAG: rod shape-determining protein [Candidatus Edwardsbacteria bacterium RifOxyC12_full_54_24]OGF08447.1 MAG: rod shape-determining protein [Candidatus Edwardsbacteria bacterium GWF2_54_11]OGF09123.1 MAG: rod shape-determining protein [Candidatus Edwardsbacteria bacterium RifOxyA12_full_54_48]OGF12353.1 MAG: rod shape-determining protein [Candidatus Edwardsbacteria bacterium GWE2_54_12]OGF15693.1 MAG: rod shape-determining protein [Candidatus Edwardsbacteria bacterium RIFOXYD12_FULL_50_11]O